jgi:hypothetical protein
MELHFLARDAYRDGGMKAGRSTNDAAPKKETNKQTNKQTAALSGVAIARHIQEDSMKNQRKVSICKQAPFRELPN